ncbi:ATP synthase A1 subunit C [Methanosarcinales archaeon ex4572_44]|nr:MAG: ATP synthase A1 subunit C [Methanosarcinales archaeon ex4484_138]PHP45435.1 MAG: ATP synthase A1 subunit C [Methanosarcinales archaeon ex4572_44]RLG27454.1 MAG: ATP synthase A1 subunit C [Methanosarcinales archaeon]HHI30151.1 ATP synthase A1 subunit C [Candidatus Methanoperedenaceae archaeon]
MGLFKTPAYAYITARVRARKKKLIPKDTYPKLLNMELPEIIRFIEESEYKRDVDELSARFRAIDLLEHALNRNLGASYRKLIEISRGQVNYLIVEYMRRWDIWNIKTVLRGKYYGAPEEEILDYVVSAGGLHYPDLESMAKLESVDAIITSLQNRPCYQVLKDYEGGMLNKIEDDLDKLYYSRLLDAIGVSPGEKLFLKFLQTEIDIKNLKTLFRLKRAGVEREGVQDVIIPGGLEFKGSDLIRLAGLSFSELIHSLDGYSYWSSIADVVSEEGTSLTEIETKLDAYLMNFASRISHYYPLSILPVLDYVLHKKIEVDNLRIIARGKELKLSDDVIRDNLVM